MATNTIDVVWRRDLNFDGNQQDAVIKLASPLSPEDGAVSPKQLLLTALAGCTAMDVASLLPKMRVPFTSLVVRATGELTDEHPKVYSDIHVVYEVGSSPEYCDQIKRAVELSETKYCGVSAMLAKAARITYEIKCMGETCTV
ncbi:MAG: OsmC family protein [Bradyrhizobiaceae bacterium]|nr:OsmC family protein [Bradyrhizobiaceae bacterium]